MMNEEAHTAIIGGGTMGADIAVIFAAGGWMAHIVEPAEAVRGNLSARLKTGLEALKSADAYDHIDLCTALAELPWKTIGFVVECVPEDLSIKQTVFQQLETLSLPETPLTSNSSSFPISHIGKGLSTLSRMAGLQRGGRPNKK